MVRILFVVFGTWRLKRYDSSSFVFPNLTKEINEIVEKKEGQEIAIFVTLWVWSRVMLGNGSALCLSVRPFCRNMSCIGYCCWSLQRNRELSNYQAAPNRIWKQEKSFITINGHWSPGIWWIFFFLHLGMIGCPQYIFYALSGKRYWMTDPGMSIFLA